MNLNLEPNEVQFILQVLGEMPAKSGVWPLIVKIQEQAAAPPQIPTQEMSEEAAIGGTD
jgi:hypothetical protein